MKSILEIEYNEELWKQLDKEMDEYGKLELNDCEGIKIQVVPITEFNCFPGNDAVIEMIVSLTRDVAVGLFVSWLYEKMKTVDIKTIIINGMKCDTSDKKELKSAIEKNDDE